MKGTRGFDGVSATLAFGFLHFSVSYPAVLPISHRTDYPTGETGCVFAPCPLPPSYLGLPLWLGREGILPLPLEAGSLWAEVWELLLALSALLPILLWDLRFSNRVLMNLLTFNCQGLFCVELPHLLLVLRWEAITDISIDCVPLGSPSSPNRTPKFSNFPRRVRGSPLGPGLNLCMSLRM